MPHKESLNNTVTRKADAEETQMYMEILAKRNTPLTEREIRSVYRNEFYSMNSASYYKYST